MLTVTLSNKFTESYGYTDDHVYSNTLVHLVRWRQDYLLGSMGTVVDLSKGNTYLATLLLW